EQFRRTRERSQVERAAARVGEDGRIVRAVGGQFDLVERHEDLLVLIAESVGDVHIQGRASAGCRHGGAGTTRSASASRQSRQGEQREQKRAGSSESLHTAYILSFFPLSSR